MADSLTGDGKQRPGALGPAGPTGRTRTCLPECTIHIERAGVKTTTHWDISATTVDNPDGAREFIDEQSEMYNNWGTKDISLFLGPGDSDLLRRRMADRDFGKRLPFFGAFASQTSESRSTC